MRLAQGAFIIKKPDGLLSLSILQMNQMTSDDFQLLLQREL